MITLEVTRERTTKALPPDLDETGQGKLDLDLQAKTEPSRYFIGCEWIGMGQDVTKSCPQAD